MPVSADAVPLGHRHPAPFHTVYGHVHTIVTSQEVVKEATRQRFCRLGLGEAWCRGLPCARKGAERPRWSLPAR